MMNPRPSHAPLVMRLALAAMLLMTGRPLLAQMEIDTFAVALDGDTARFWVQIPELYDAAQPPAVLVWWHQLGGNQWEMRASLFDSVANARGWIAASHAGPNDRHWNSPRAQNHCRAMLDWLQQEYPFHMDSIYMIGGSMGGAGGQVWHNNNCGEHDYLLAAVAGGSQILDCQLRQEQYLASGDTNRSMRAAFGGLPGERDSVAFAYHRASAVFLADTSQSMHFNALHLPVWANWGDTDLERVAYGDPARSWDSLRVAGGADTTLLFEAEFACHGLGCMNAGSVCDWLAGFAANRHPDDLSINADEDGEYYWTTVELAQNDTVFGRYGVTKRPELDELDVTFVHNIQALNINAATLDLVPNADTLRGVWTNHDPGIPAPAVILTSMPAVTAVFGPGESDPEWSYDSTTQICTVWLAESGLYRVVVGTAASSTSGPETPELPRTHILAGAYPNPFNARTTLSIHSPGGRTDLLVYDVLGRLVRTLPLTLRAGSNTISLDVSALGSGVFFAILRDSSHPPLKMLLLR